MLHNDTCQDNYGCVEDAPQGDIPEQQWVSRRYSTKRHTKTTMGVYEMLLKETYQNNGCVGDAPQRDIAEQWVCRRCSSKRHTGTLGV